MSENKLKRDQDDNKQSRRSFLTATSVGAAAVAAAPMMVTKVAEASPSKGQWILTSKKRIREAFNVRHKAALIQKLFSLRQGHQKVNGDEQRYRKQNYYASFTKTLPHDNFGEVDPDAFEALVKAMNTQRQSDFNKIPLDPSAAQKLANPQGALMYIMTGLDSHSTRLAAPPKFRSALAAAELGEVYWLALTRDVPFAEYGSDAAIGAALSDLNQFSSTVGPKVGGQVTAGTLFRGKTPGDLVGPYISQFLWKDIGYGASTIVQRYKVPLAGTDFMTDVGNWLNIQRGGAPMESLVFDDARYIYNNRALGEYVHTDVLFQAFFNAALIALGYGGAALDNGNPYKSSITNQGGFTSLGGPYIIDLVCKAANLALTGAWYHKWSVHRKLRPEAMSGRVHFTVNGQKNYELHPDILNSAAVSELLSANGTALLPMAFTEGSPTHPSFPAGHATISGACATVLKACFNEDFVIPDPVVANVDGTALLNYMGSSLTLGGEFNKLANNVSLGRDAAGVHYRSDGEEGLIVGEEQAIALLQDASLTHNESMSFTLTKFDGTKIRIAKGTVKKI